jgi:flagellar basal body rod protein FlgG
MPKVNIHHNAVQKPNAVALSLQEAQWRRLEVVTNNIANAHTPGFKQTFLKLEESHQLVSCTPINKLVT